VAVRRIMRLMVPCLRCFMQFMVWTEVPGQPWRRECEAGPSLSSKRGRHVRPGHCSASEATSIRVERDLVGTRERTGAEHAVARSLLHVPVVHPVPSKRGDMHDLKPEIPMDTSALTPCS
jgi:hypothetical protein